MVNLASITARPVRLAPCYRIVASRMPTINLFERVAKDEVHILRDLYLLG
jgi:hypothetical protein